MRNEFTRSIRTRLAIILLCAFAALAGLIVHLSLAQRAALLESAAERLADRARLLAGRQMALLHRGDAILNALMQLPPPGPVQDSPCSRQFTEQLLGDPAFVQMGILGPDGRVACSAIPPSATVSFADRPWFKSALASEQTVVSDIVEGRILGKPLISIAKAQRNAAGEVLRVYFVALGIDWLRREFLAADLPGATQLLLTDSQGAVLMNQVADGLGMEEDIALPALINEALAAETAGARLVSPAKDGKALLFAHAPLLHAQSNRYHVLLIQPADLIETPLRQALFSSLGVALALLLATLAAIYLAIRHGLIKPLAGIAQAARRLGTGDFSARNDLPRGVGELGALTQALDEMAASLQEVTVSRHSLKLEIEQHRLTALHLQYALAGGNAGTFDWDLATNLCTWSPEMWALLGLDPRTVPASRESWWQTVPPDMRDSLQTAFDTAVARGDEISFEYPVLTRNDPEPCWLLGRARPLRDDESGQIVRYLGILIDISERKRAEERLASYRDHLEDIVSDQTSRLQGALDDLESFVYAASHDLQGPLGRIRSFAGLLGERQSDALGEDGPAFLQIIRENTERLQSVIDDLLAHARVGDQFSLSESIAVPEIVARVLEERREDIAIAGARIYLDLADNLFLNGNPTFMTEVMRNLVDNALKYSAHAKPPSIEIGGRRDAHRIHLWVRDNGIGIAPAYQEKIFGIFRRLHTYSEFPGTGIGLALVRKVITRMNGKVWVDSQPGCGATFHIELPHAGRVSAPILAAA